MAGWLKAMADLRPGLESAGLALLALAFLLTAPLPRIDARMPETVRYIDVDAGLETVLSDPGAGQPLAYRSIERPGTTGWLVWDDVPIAQDGPPPAISTSGPFSATLWFNGVRIGEKGQPGATPADEVAGPIDSLFAVPARLIEPDGNQLVMRLSSHRAGYTPYSLVQSLFVMPYSSETRRSVRYYLPLVILGAGLVALALAFALRSRRLGDGRGIWLSVSLAGLTLAGLAEISRAMINYPYDWHQPRQALSLLGLALFGFALLRFAQLRWAATGRLAWIWMGATGLIALTGLLALTGYDAKSAAVTASLISSAAVWIAWRGDGPARTMAVGLAIIPLYALALPSDLIDRGVYALVLGLLALPAIRWPDLLQPVPVAPPEILALQATGRLTRLACPDIVHLTAAGNYTEVHTRAGVTHLDNRNLSALVDLLPDAFVRVHRSHAVNLAHVEALTSEVGSRYQIVLATGASIPVSRREVAGLRERLAGRKA
ncbi:LytTR family DNA-binding domain-containing protein [Maricaulis sp. W15]|uniref:LytTR family DNA-binding domain-containing protein n=1 Tax=Maricaulis sp. W15 TaxID=1772333 RepID=UPI001300D210|nr:LytTR family DNA-binding domain-containing protein [Maricaulis sp. W15]